MVACAPPTEHAPHDAAWHGSYTVPVDAQASWLALSVIRLSRSEYSPAARRCWITAIVPRSTSVQLSATTSGPGWGAGEGVGVSVTNEYTTVSAVVWSRQINKHRERVARRDHCGMGTDAGVAVDGRAARTLVPSSSSS